MLKSYPTVQEFDDNDFQRGYVHAMNLVASIIQSKYDTNYDKRDSDLVWEVEHFKEMCISPIFDAIHRYEPGHDKPANSF
jgi:hypothetical protein